MVSNFVGLELGNFVGLTVGTFERLAEGLMVLVIGLELGDFEALLVTGLRVGTLEGSALGLPVGLAVIFSQNGTAHSSHRLSGSVV